MKQLQIAASAEKLQLEKKLLEAKSKQDQLE
jgi:hypothetical protein